MVESEPEKQNESDVRALALTLTFYLLSLLIIANSILEISSS